MTNASTTHAQSTASVIDAASLQGLKDSLRGQLLSPSDEGYDAARMVPNAMIDKRPAVIVRCAGIADVICAVKFARRHDLLVAVRGGGHSVSGKSVCDGGILIDFSLMKGIRVDPSRRTVRAQPGLLLGEFDRETQAFGLATTLGLQPDTGIAGLTLGGGLGWLNGKHGLACDNLISVDVVTADGRFLTASHSENQDLFWGVRGGGGNFGIVTSFEYQLHPVGEVLGGEVWYELSKAEGVLHKYHEFTRSCPDELSTLAGLTTNPDGNLGVVIYLCYCGPLDVGEKIVKPLRSFEKPIADLIRPMTYLEVQGATDETPRPRYLRYWKGNFLRALSDDAITMMVECAEAMPWQSVIGGLELQHMHGAASRIGMAETAFAHRYEQYDFLVHAGWTDPADSEKIVNWVRESWQRMQPFTEQAVYINDLGEEGEGRVKDAYGPNYERMLALKNKYDPTNFFRLNQNIQPTA